MADVIETKNSFTLIMEDGKPYETLVHLIQFDRPGMKFTFGRMEVSGVQHAGVVLGPSGGKIMNLEFPGLGETKMFAYRGETTWDPNPPHTPITHVDFFVL